MKMMGRNVATLGAVSILNTLSVTAQNLSYGADNFYVSDIVSVRPITFPNLYNMTVAGNLFIRNNFNSSIGLPAIVVGHPMGAVKEQSANLYATKLAEQGFVTVSVDLSFWGGSDGEPRNAVLPDLYSESFIAAVDYLGLQSFVDSERIGALGICGSGGFVISAAKIDPRMKAIATASMYDMGAVNRNGLQKALDLAQRKEIIAAANEQRVLEAEGGETVFTGGTVLELVDNSTDVEREFYDFYRTSRGRFTPEGAEVNATTKPTLSSSTKFMNFYPFSDIETISPRPMLFISGDLSHSREFSEDAYHLAGYPKELVWVPGASHVDLYDRVELIPFDKLTNFFQNGLAATNATSASR